METNQNIKVLSRFDYRGYSCIIFSNGLYPSAYIALPSSHTYYNEVCRIKQEVEAHIDSVKSRSAYNDIDNMLKSMSCTYEDYVNQIINSRLSVLFSSIICHNLLNFKLVNLYNIPETDGYWLGWAYNRYKTDYIGDIQDSGRLWGITDITYEIKLVVEQLERLNMISII